MKVSAVKIISGLESKDSDFEGFMEFMETANFLTIFLTPTLPLEDNKAVIVVTGINPPLLTSVQCESLEEAEEWLKEQEQWKGKRRFPVGTTGFTDPM